MARPRSFNTDEFLDRSLDLFWRRGFAATSMSDVYEATGLGAGSVYAYVRDKNELFRRVFERYGSMFTASLPVDLEGAAALHLWMSWLAEYLADDPDRKGCLIANTIMERFAHTPETLALAEGRLEEVRAWFERQIATGCDRGELRADLDPPAAASTLVATTLGLMAMARARAPRGTLIKVGADAVEALRARSAPHPTVPARTRATPDDRA